MKPVDYRNETFADIKARLAGERLNIYRAWLIFGPCTTEQLAERSGVSILTLRPRTTELFQLGMVVLVEDGQTERQNHVGQNHPPHDSAIHDSALRGGVYRACSEFEARGLFDAAKRLALQEQLVFPKV